MRAFVLLVNELLGTLEGQLPLLAVLGLVDAQQLAEETALAAILRNQPFALHIGLLKAEAVALIIARQAFIAPGRNLVHGNDARLVKGFAGILIHLVVVLPVEGCFAKT